MENNICKHCLKKIYRTDISKPWNWVHKNGFMYCGKGMKTNKFAEPLSEEELRILKLERIIKK